MAAAHRAGEDLFAPHQACKKSCGMKNQVEQDNRNVPVIDVDERKLRTHVSEAVRPGMEETLNGLRETEAAALCTAMRSGPAPMPCVMNGASRRQRGTGSPWFRICAICPLRRPASSAIAAGKALCRVRSWKCISQRSRSARWRTSLKPCGAAVSAQAPSATRTRRFSRGGMAQAAA